MEPYGDWTLHLMLYEARLAEQQDEQPDERQEADRSAGEEGRIAPDRMSVGALVLHWLGLGLSRAGG